MKEPFAAPHNSSQERRLVAAAPRGHSTQRTRSACKRDDRARAAMVPFPASRLSLTSWAANHSRHRDPTKYIVYRRLHIETAVATLTTIGPSLACVPGTANPVCPATSLPRRSRGSSHSSVHCTCTAAPKKPFFMAELATAGPGPRANSPCRTPLKARHGDRRLVRFEELNPHRPMCRTL